VNRRLVFKLALLLVLGAIVNVAVAWGLALQVPRPSGLTGDGTLLLEWHYGWPSETFAGRCWHRPELSSNELFPLLPIWPGFAINTVFYAVVLWLLFAAPFALRRWRRIRRGLCPKCAYDLRGTQTSVCPECGATR